MTPNKEPSKMLAAKLRGFAATMKEGDIPVWGFTKTGIWEIIAALEASNDIVEELRAKVDDLRLQALTLAEDIRLDYEQSPGGIQRTETEIEEGIEKDAVYNQRMAEVVAYSKVLAILTPPKKPVEKP